MGPQPPMLQPDLHSHLPCVLREDFAQVVAGLKSIRGPLGEAALDDAG